jgi:SAM-dependent methyltransferase
MPSPAERIVDLYEENAEEWDRQRNRNPEQRLLQPERLFERPWLDRFLALLRPGATVLDLGCGSGVPIGSYLIHRGVTLTGVDSSASLIAICRSRFLRCEWSVADMRGLDLGRRFDGILAWDSFFHLNHADQRLMFSVFSLHAGPGAVLMFTSGHEHGEVLSEFAGEPLYHSSLNPSEYRALLSQHNFQVVSHVLRDPSCGEHTIWLARFAGQAESPPQPETS